MRKMLGQSFQMQEMIEIMLVLVIAGVLFIIMALITGSAGPLVDQICEQHPEWPWCQDQTTMASYRSAIDSSAALTCAINSVAQGSVWNGDFQLETISDTINCQDFYSADGGDKVSLGCVSGSNQVMSKINIDIRTHDADDECKKRYGDDAVAMATTGENIDYIKEYECYAKPLTCTVRNFQLPEDYGGIFDNVQDFLDGFGDPSFLVYFQNFPAGEDADWAGASAWYQGIGRVMLWSICFSHVLGPAMRLIGPAVTRPVKTVVQAAGKTGSKLKSWLLSAAQRAGMSADDVARVAQNVDDGNVIVYGALKGKSLADDITKFIAKTQVNRGVVDYFKTQSDDVVDAFTLYIEPAVSSGKISGLQIDDALTGFRAVWNGGDTAIDLAQYLDDIPAEGMITILLKEVNAENAITVGKTLVSRIGFAGLGAYVLARIDSAIGKFVPESSSIILKKPLVEKQKDEFGGLPMIEYKSPVITNPIEQNIVDIGKPVMLEKTAIFQGTDKPFYLASPCYAEELKIESDSDVVCEVYSYDMKSGIVACDNSENILNFLVERRCGALPTPLDLAEPKINEILEKETEIVQNMDDYTIFSDEINLNVGDETITRYEISNPLDNIKLYYDKKSNSIDYYSLNNGEAQSVGNSEEIEIECEVEHTPIGIEKDMGLEAMDQDTVLKCSTNDVRYLLNRGVITKIILYGNFNENSVKFFALRIERATLNTILRDDNNDGKVDNLGHYTTKLMSIPSEVPLPVDDSTLVLSANGVFDDTDFDGEIDHVNSNYCRVGSITIDVEFASDEYLDENEIENNYCYKKESSGIIGAAGTVLAFSIGALTKVLKVGGLTGAIISTGVDCGIAIGEYFLADSTWPEG